MLRAWGFRVLGIEGLALGFGEWVGWVETLKEGFRDFRLP